MSSRSCSTPTITSTTTIWSLAATLRCSRLCCSAVHYSTPYWLIEKNSGQSVGLHLPKIFPTLTCLWLKTNCGWWLMSRIACSSRSFASLRQLLTTVGESQMTKTKGSYARLLIGFWILIWWPIQTNLLMTMGSRKYLNQKNKLILLNT